MAKLCKLLQDGALSDFTEQEELAGWDVMKECHKKTCQTIHWLVTLINEKEGE